MAKVIRSFNMDLSDMAQNGFARPFSVEGDPGAIFSLEVSQTIMGSGTYYYYNFDTATFTTTKFRLKQKATGGNGKYNDSITFPVMADADTVQYDIYLFAESAHDTTHSDYKEVRFGDDSVDINSSRGSNSNLVQKVIYQYTDTAIRIYPWMQTLGGAAVSWIDSYVYANVTFSRGKNPTKKSFEMSVTAGATEGLRLLRQPIENDFFKEIDVRWEPTHASSQGALTGAGLPSKSAHRVQRRARII